MKALHCSWPFLLPSAATHTLRDGKKGRLASSVCVSAHGVCVCWGGFGVAAALASGGQLPFYMKEAQLL